MQSEEFNAFDVKDGKGKVLETWQLPKKPLGGSWAVATHMVNELGLLVPKLNGPQVGFDAGLIYLNNWASASVAPVYQAMTAEQGIVVEEVPEAA